MLSEIEVQELIEDLGLLEDSPPPSPSSPEASPSLKPSPITIEPIDKLLMFKQQHDKQKNMIKRSSFIPSKVTKKRPDSFPEKLIAQSSLKVPFKIPKISTSSSESPTVPEKKAPVLLKSFDMFKSLKGVSKMPARRWSVACNKNIEKFHSISPKIDKIKIIKSPSSSKSHEIVKLTKSEPSFGSPAVSKAEDEDKKPSQVKDEDSKAPDDIEKSLDRLFSGASEPSFPVSVEKKRRASTSKISKELRRLQEDIVKR